MADKVGVRACSSPFGNWKTWRTPAMARTPNWCSYSVWVVCDGASWPGSRSVTASTYVPGRGLRLQRAVLASGAGGELFVDTLKNKRARTVPLIADVVPIIDRWATGKEQSDWLFSAPRGGPLSEGNWKRSVRWTTATRSVGVPGFRVHDLRHTAASVWLAAGADPKVVQRILGHATASMTMDLYGHLIDDSLWDAARKVTEHTGGLSGTSKGADAEITEPPESESGL